MRIKLKEVIQKIKPIKTIGHTDLDVTSVVAIGDKATTRESIYWCSDKNRDQLKDLKTGIVLVSADSYSSLEGKKVAKSEQITWLLVEKPRFAFMQVLKIIQEGVLVRGVISKTACIDASSEIDQSTVFVGENVVIERGVKMGANVSIDHNTVIKSGTIIGNNVKVGCNCTIGGMGFGYELNEAGMYELIPHMGNVVIHDNAEVGNSVCIDRAVLGSTIIGSHVKVDNLVHIAHGVEIAENSLIIANSMIAGSVKIGRNCWVAPSVSIIQKVSVGDNSVVGLGSVVLKDVDANTVVAGVPAKKLKDKQ